MLGLGAARKERSDARQDAGTEPTMASRLSDRYEAFDIGTARALVLQSCPTRLVFAAIYGLVSLSLLPWHLNLFPPKWVLAWLAVLLAWEFVNGRALDWMVANLSGVRAITFFAVSNSIGSILFSLVAAAGLATGSPLGVALGATWLAGMFMNTFVYYGGNKILLLSVLWPGVAAAVIGPMLLHGPTPTSSLISCLVLSCLLATRQFSIDHGVLLQRVADWQRALANVEGKLSIAVEASGDGMFEVDLLSGRSEVSQGWASMLGYQASEMAIGDPMRFVHPEDLDLVTANYSRHFGGETPHTSSEYRVLRKDGQYIWVLSRARLVERTADGTPWRLLGTVMDISARKLMEQQLEAARDEAESANAAKSRFIANMSHEIRTPLNGVIGIAGVLERTALSSNQREMVTLIQSSAAVLERMLSDILDQSKLEAGEFEQQIAPFDLRETVQAASELMRARADEKGLVFETIYGDGAEGQFEGDAVRLRQIISNLASNAIKFTEVGAVRILVGATASETDADTVDLTLTVSDTGIGFDAETAQRLFARFAQADSSISRRFGGTGLGLAISKALAERMGGELTATSQPGAGSAFTLKIPLKRTLSLADHRAGKGRGVVMDADDPLASLAGLRILLAEDHPTNQRVVQLILGAFDIDLIMVDNGQEAVEAFRARRFDLVLMDMQMPVMDGLTATRDIRRFERETGAITTPIAMLTANALVEHREAAHSAGATHHIAKPITPESLVQGILTALLTDQTAAERQRA